MSEGRGFVVRLRGLPWSTKAAAVVHFLRECEIVGGVNGVHFTYSREGRPSGEAFVELATEDDVRHALAQNNEHIGNRYIEVFKADRSEMDWAIKRTGVAQNQSNTDAIVKLRGLPFGCSKEEIAQFFTGLEIVPNGIMLPEDRQGRSTGEAFVQFASSQIAERALEKHKERIGHRYIEIFKSSMSEANAAGNLRGIRPLMAGALSPRLGPYDRGDRFGFDMGVIGMPYSRGYGRNLKGLYDDEYDDYDVGMGFGMCSRLGGMRSARSGYGTGSRLNHRSMQQGSGYVSRTGHSVHMRGLPYQAVEQDIFDFFSPIQPVRCEFEFGDNGRPTGEANVDFATHKEALEAMKKHKCNMQYRYIELFLHSEPNSRRAFGGNYGSSLEEAYGGRNFGARSLYEDDYDLEPRYVGGGGYGSRTSQSFGGGGMYGNSFRNPGGFSSYSMGGGYGDGLGDVGGGMMGNNYSAY